MGREHANPIFGFPGLFSPPIPRAEYLAKPANSDNDEEVGLEPNGKGVLEANNILPRLISKFSRRGRRDRNSAGGKLEEGVPVKLQLYRVQVGQPERQQK